MADEAIIKIVKICSTPEERIDGLQDTPIARDECCVFIYETKKTMPKFWGKNTPNKLYATLVNDGIAVDSQVINAMDESSVVLYGEGDIVIESRKKIYPGAKVVFNGNELKIVS